jgi:hypothetical protein
MKINGIVLFIIFLLIAQIVTWFQINLQFIYPKYRDNYWLLLTGIPITWLFIRATRHGVEAFDGQMWPQRLISFATGIVIFTIMTHFVMGETLSIKNIICLAMASIIVLIQILF